MLETDQSLLKHKLNLRPISIILDSGKGHQQMLQPPNNNTSYGLNLTEYLLVAWRGLQDIT